MTELFGPGPQDFSYAAYAWSSDGSDAIHVRKGQKNANGSGHDIPDEGMCRGCHDGLRERKTSRHLAPRELHRQAR